MARKTKVEKDREAREAETASNTTRENIVVRPGQIWMDMNPRNKGRTVSVSSVKAGIAAVSDGNRRSTITVSRMYPHSRGFRLYGSP
ncbi:hypothetical protein ANMWB30_23070 [Arthrobacter sp. MWB30]|nr:hypothetical protein ANMWB30_23070 [Arthrobacter sp. MWB30]